MRSQTVVEERERQGLVSRILLFPATRPNSCTAAQVYLFSVPAHPPAASHAITTEGSELDLEPWTHGALDVQHLQPHIEEKERESPHT
eukprot:19944-Eustigmatos_ZCMA.PRE.1